MQVSPEVAMKEEGLASSLKLQSLLLASKYKDETDILAAWNCLTSTYYVKVRSIATLIPVESAICKAPIKYVRFYAVVKLKFLGLLDGKVMAAFCVSTCTLSTFSVADLLVSVIEN